MELTWNLLSKVRSFYFKSCTLDNKEAQSLIAKSCLILNKERYYQPIFLNLAIKFSFLKNKTVLCMHEMQRGDSLPQ